MIQVAEIIVNEEPFVCDKSYIMLDNGYGKIIIDGPAQLIDYEVSLTEFTEIEVDDMLDAIEQSRCSIMKDMFLKNSGYQLYIKQKTFGDHRTFNYIVDSDYNIKIDRE